jgi:hypothetical protein
MIQAFFRLLAFSIYLFPPASPHAPFRRFHKINYGSCRRTWRSGCDFLPFLFFLEHGEHALAIFVSIRLRLEFCRRKLLI